MKSISPFVVVGVVLLTAVHVLDPPVIATVDLERVFHEIEVRKQAEVSLQAQIKVFRVREQELRTEAERHAADLEMYAPGTDKYDTAQKQHMQSVLDFSAMGEFIEYRLDATRAEARRDLFAEIVEEAAKYAEQNGIDFLFANDSKRSLENGTDRQIVQQLALRRMIYADDAYDITDELIDWINAP